MLPREGIEGADRPLNMARSGQRPALETTAFGYSGTEDPCPSRIEEGPRSARIAPTKRQTANQSAEAADKWDIEYWLRRGQSRVQRA